MMSFDEESENGRKDPKEMDTVNIEIVTSPSDAKNLDDLLWQTLWRPLNLPRDIRQRFTVEGEELELVAKTEGRIVGGLVAFWTGVTEVELRHLAIIREAQNQGIGKLLVKALVKLVGPEGCRRIHTTARNTSAGFFRKVGFRKIPGTVPEHLDFKKHGILFQAMEKILESPDAGGV